MSIGETNTYTISVEIDVTDNGPDEAFSVDHRNIYVNGKHVYGQGSVGIECAVFRAIQEAAYALALDDEWEVKKPQSWDGRDTNYEDMFADIKASNGSVL